MNRFVILLSLALFPLQVSSHEMTPTYPEFKSSYIDGVSITKMRLFNSRADVDYYQIDVFDVNWNSIPFATTNRIMGISYLQTTYFDIYVRDLDEKQVEYICTTSKIKKDTTATTAISSRICSKIK